MRSAHGANAQNAGEFFIFIGLRNRATMSQGFLSILQIFQRRVILRLILSQMAIGLRFLQVLFFGVCGLGNLLEKLIGLSRTCRRAPRSLPFA